MGIPELALTHKLSLPCIYTQVCTYIHLESTGKITIIILCSSLLKGEFPSVDRFHKPMFWSWGHLADLRTKKVGAIVLWDRTEYQKDGTAKALQNVHLNADRLQGQGESKGHRCPTSVTHASLLPSSRAMTGSVAQSSVWFLRPFTTSSCFPKCSRLPPCRSVHSYQDKPGCQLCLRLSEAHSAGQGRQPESKRNTATKSVQRSGVSPH